MLQSWYLGSEIAQSGKLGAYAYAWALRFPRVECMVTVLILRLLDCLEWKLGAGAYALALRFPGVENLDIVSILVL